MKASELRELGREGIKRRLAELQDELLKLRLRRATEELPNPIRLRVLRRDIARCLTVLKELEHKETGGENA
jgi:large subunit ribosomal protein L29|uniref:Large ribosomal subunit protein uL29 n=1 Tax=candidate division WOR-3 bacterium TaxID=2052148 RepID=A0A7V3PSN2_UNCW3